MSNIKWVTEEMAMAAACESFESALACTKAKWQNYVVCTKEELLDFNKCKRRLDNQACAICEYQYQEEERERERGDEVHSKCKTCFLNIDSIDCYDRPSVYSRARRALEKFLEDERECDFDYFYLKAKEMLELIETESKKVDNKE